MSKHLAPVLLLIAAIVIPPVMLPPLLASSAGLLIIGNLNYKMVADQFTDRVDRTLPLVELASVVPPQGASGQHVFVLDKGIVTFKMIEGKLTSRYTKNSY